MDFEVLSVLYTALVFLVTMFLKDLGVEFAAGIGFYLDKQFRDKDKVFINGEEAVIHRIGIRRTVFIIKETNRKRFVLNTRIKLLTLEIINK